MEDMGTVGATHCHSCRGTGVTVRQVSVLELSTGQGGTGLVHVTCPHCSGNGKLPGFQPPV